MRWLIRLHQPVRSVTRSLRPATFHQRRDATEAMVPHPLGPSTLAASRFALRPSVLIDRLAVGPVEVLVVTDRPTEDRWEVLSREQCLTLLATQQVGRLGSASSGFRPSSR
jgi:hypothetical protein